jgi:hypothetical protein
VDLRGMEPAQQDVAAREVADRERVTGFDASRPPLLRFVLIRLGHQRFRLVLTHHHILWDGWSSPVLLQELFTLYSDGGSAAALPPAVPFSRYLTWLAGWDRSAAESAWSEALAGLPEPTLVADQTMVHAAVVPESVRMQLSEDFTAALTDMARRVGVTLNTVVQAIWGVFLARFTGRGDVVFGATVSGRPPQVADVERMVGLFINTIPVRVRVRENESVAQLLTRLQRAQTDLLPHHYLSLPQIQRAAGLGVLFDTLTVLQNYPVDETMWNGSDQPAGARTTGLAGRDATHYPLALIVAPGERLRFRLDYQPDVFTVDAAEAVLAGLVRLLESAVADPDRAVSGLEVLEPAERRTVLVEWNDTARPVPAASCCRRRWRPLRTRWPWCSRTSRSRTGS